MKNFRVVVAVLAVTFGIFGCVSYKGAQPGLPAAQTETINNLEKKITELQGQVASASDEELKALEQEIADLTKAAEDLKKTLSGPAEPPPSGGPPGAADTTPPVVIETTPAKDATDVPAITTISVKFDGKLKPGSVTKDSLIFSPVSVTPVSASSVNDTNNPEFIFTVPATVLGKTYKVTLKKDGVQDEAGNARAEDYTWTFATATQPPAVLGNLGSIKTHIPNVASETPAISPGCGGGSTIVGTDTAGIITVGVISEGSWNLGCQISFSEKYKTPICTVFIIGVVGDPNNGIRIVEEKSDLLLIQSFPNKFQGGEKVTYICLEGTP